MGDSGSKPQVDDLDLETDAERKRFLRYTSLVAGVVLLVGCVWSLIAGSAMTLTLGLLVALGFTLASLRLARRDRDRLAVRLFVIGNFATLTCMLFLADERLSAWTALLGGFVILGSWLLSARWAVGIAAAGAAALLVSGFVDIFGGRDTAAYVIENSTRAAVHLAAVAAFLVYFDRRATNSLATFREKLAQSDDLHFRIPEEAARLGAAIREFFATAHHQSQNAIRQLSGIQQMRDVMGSLLDSSGRIVDSSKTALDDADGTIDDAVKVSESLANLTDLTDNIAGILETINELATKLETLAFHADLQGTKAGHAGGGFSDVANQMQSLVENITATARGIATLTQEIQISARATTTAMAETSELATATQDVARQISLIAQQQRSSVAQISGAMEDIAEISGEFGNASDETLDLVDDLKALAEQLAEVADEGDGRRAARLGRRA